MKLDVIIAKSRPAVLACLLVVLAGCTPKFIIQVDGYPLPEEFNVAWSSDGAIRAKWFFVRWHPQKIESQGFSEYIEQPEYLSTDGLNVVPADTQAVVINLSIVNPKRKKYRLVKVVQVGEKSLEEPMGDWTIREHNALLVAGPLQPGKEVKLAAKILSWKEGDTPEPVISTGELRYRLKGAPTANAGETLEEVTPGRPANTVSSSEAAAKAPNPAAPKAHKPKDLPVSAKVPQPKPAQEGSSTLGATLKEKEVPTVKYVGSDTSNKYHYPTCKWAKKIHPKKVVGFTSVKEAKQAGYIQCLGCRPPVKDEAPITKAGVPPHQKRERRQ